MAMDPPSTPASGSRRRPSRPSFLTEQSLRDMLGWARSHERLFRENAAKAGLADSTEQALDAGDAFASILHMLDEVDGYRHVRSVIQKGPGRTIEQAVHRSTKGVLPAGRNRGSTQIHDIATSLVDQADYHRAAWVIWTGRNLAGGGPAALTPSSEDLPYFDDLVSRHEELAALLAPAEETDSSAAPDERGASTGWVDLVSSLIVRLREARMPSIALANELRSAADHIERATERREDERRLARDRLRSAFVAAAGRIVASGCRLPAVADLLRSPEDAVAGEADLGRLAELVEGAERLADVAERWGERYRAQDFFGDMQGFGELTESARRQAEALASLHGSPLPADRGAANPPDEAERRATGDGPAAHPGAGQLAADDPGREPDRGLDPAPPPPAAPALNADDGRGPRSEDVPPEAHLEEAWAGDDDLVRGPVDPVRERAHAAARAAMSAALRDGRLGLAAHVASALEAAGEPAADGIVLPLVKAVIAGLSVGYPDSEGAAGVFEVQVPSILDKEGGHAVKLLTFSAALRPALFAFGTGAEELLRNTDELRIFGPDLESLAVFCSQVMPRLGARFTRSELAMDGISRSPRESLDDFCRDFVDFAQNAPNRMVKFQRATAIWQSVLRLGSIRGAVEAVAEARPDARARVERALSELADLDRLIDREEARLLRGRRAKGLEAGARDKLIEWLADLAERLRTWQRLEEATKSHEPDAFRAKARRDLQTAAAAAHAALLERSSADAPMLAATSVACAALGSVLADFRGSDAARPGQRQRPEDELLLLPRRWNPHEAGSWSEDEREAFFDQILAAARTKPDYGAAFERALADECFEDALRARDRLAGDGYAAADLLRIDDQFKGAREQALVRVVTRIRSAGLRLNDLLGADDTLASRSLVPEFQRLEAQVVGPDPVADLRSWGERTADLEQRLADVCDRLLRPLIERVDRLERGGADVTELRDLEKHRDLTTLSEYLPAYESGEAAAATRPSALLRRFATEILGEANLPSLESVERALDQQAALSFCDFQSFGSDELRTSKELLEIWRALRRNVNQSSGPQLRRLFEALLAVSAHVMSASPQSKERYTLRITPALGRPEDSLAPDFGSAAGGRYDLILIEEANIRSGRDIARHKLEAPTFFVVRGVMSAAARKRFMITVREQGMHPACALVDEALVLFLAMQRERRRSDLFSLALPMGAVQPYSDAAQQTSPEMFFGRREEMAQIWDPQGSCLVYGGRQLGKTALLRQVQLQRATASQIVIYGDEKVEASGRTEPDQFWAWIGRKAEEAGIALGEARRADRVQGAVLSWLNGDSARRIVFLIDEADELLRSEIRNDFPILLQARELMMRTGRRIKFVFAGLHDVQRLARAPNSPILHFGVPIRVGPLMGRDLVAARQMVEGPMAIAGYAFDDRALIGRALSEVGYYPSLMQTLGRALIERLNSAFGTRLSSPAALPLSVRSADLDQVLGDSRFRENVVEKFQKTLDLDERYRLIAYCIVLMVSDHAEAGSGVSIADVRREALSWWARGFAEDSSLDVFEGLLKEMEGLGVLIITRDGGYAIRSARVAAMLGSREQVEQRTLELAAKEYDHSIDTGSFRRLLQGLPSPLTQRQEGALIDMGETRPVTVALGTAALGLGLLPDAVKGLFTADNGPVVEDATVTSVRELGRAIDAVASRLKRQQRGLLVASGPWLGSEAVETALAHVEVRRARRPGPSGVRVLLLPRNVDWLEVETAMFGERLWEAAVLSLTTVGSAGLRRWTDQLGGVHPLDGPESLDRATGGFPLFFAGLGGTTAQEAAAQLRGAQDRRRADPEPCLALVGLDDARLRRAAVAIRRYGREGFLDEDRADMLELLEGDGVARAGLILSALERLCILNRTTGPGRQSRWMLNPLVDDLLSIDARR